MDLVTSRNVDFSNCDREQVQFSGAVQPHGAMLIVDEPLLTILQASRNASDILGVPDGELVGRSLSAVLGARLPEFAERLKREPLENGPVHFARLSPVDVPSRRILNLFVHRCGGATILEFEIAQETLDRPIVDLYSDLRACIGQLQATNSLQDFFDHAVQGIKRFTGFERVLAYKFLPDGSGRVTAEARDEGLESDLGLHYPATDIPAPARRLFAMSWLRHLPNVDYQPSPLVPEQHPTLQAPVDLSYSILRSVSVMYSGYLKNMGVQSTMVMPLLKEGKLWGLISAMHHSAPRHVPYEARMAAEYLAHMLSLMMAAKEDAESYAYRQRMKSVLDGVMKNLNEGADVHAGLAGPDGAASIASYIEAEGAAIITDELVTRIGDAPPEPFLRGLADWMASRPEIVIATDRLDEDYPPAQPYRATMAGLLAVRLSKTRPEFVLWCRPEQAQTVNWAGDPNKPVEVDERDGEQRLRPRASFALWKQGVQGRSKPWAEFEVKAAADLRWAIADVILARAEQTELLNRELTDLNLELDSFAYIASHDLKEPLRGINHMATFLSRGLAEKLDPGSREQLDTIMRLTRRMDDLIESLLLYSRSGRADLVLSDCDLNSLVDEVLLALKSRIEEHGTLVRRPARLPLVQGDRIRLREMLANLIGNAIKYNDKAERWVEIGVEDDAIYVRDNGIGIAPRNTDHIFQIFRRLHGRDEFGGGTGVGLTIAKKTIERHGGALWLKSEPGAGTTFYFSLPSSKK